MSRRLNYRLLFALSLIVVTATVQIIREHRPTFLRQGLRLYAFVGNAGDGTVSVVDLVRLGEIATIPVGPDPSGLRAHPEFVQVWAGIDRGRIRVRYRRGHRPCCIARPGRRRHPSRSIFPLTDVLPMSPPRDRQVWWPSIAGRDRLLRARTWPEPVARARDTRREDVLVPQCEDSTVEVFDAATLAHVAKIGVANHPEQVVILPDNSMAFVSAAGSNEISAIDLRHHVLITNLRLNGAPSALLLKPDGGELYVIVPDSHGLEIIDTWRTEISGSMSLGSAPTDGAMTADGSLVYVSDAGAGSVMPIEMATRHLLLPITTGRHPGPCALDPSGDLLLVANEDSGDLAMIRVRTQSLNVIAVDNQGQPVNDLTSDDFQVTDAGKPQKISFFRHNESKLWRTPSLGPNEFSNRGGS